MSPFVRLAAASLVMFSALACGPLGESQAEKGDGDDRGDEPAAAGLSCVEIFDCTDKCPEGDAACSDACVAKASPDGLAAAEAVAGCVQAHGCADAACAEASCAAELGTCAEQSKPPAGGQPPGGQVPPGNVPAELVGSWAVASYGVTTRLILGADGSASWQTGTTSEEGSCLIIEDITYTGTAAFGAKDFTFYSASAKTTFFECSKKTGEEPEPPLTWTSPYELVDANTMKVIDMSSCSPEYDDYNKAVYCTVTLTRE
jgi:hypothetical protein